jgi:hypothetical protein
MKQYHIRGTEWYNRVVRGHAQPADYRGLEHFDTCPVSCSFNSLQKEQVDDIESLLLFRYW